MMAFAFGMCGAEFFGEDNDQGVMIPSFLSCFTDSLVKNTK